MAFNGMFVPPDQDPRSFGKPEGELATYREYLADYRLTLELKCVDLTPEQLATRSVPPSTLSLLGLVRHCAQMEAVWFRNVLGGQPDLPRVYASPGDPDADFHGGVGTQECVDEAFATWKAVIADAEAWVESQTDADLGKGYLTRHGEPVSARDVLVHVIEEYARHCGHADLLREAIDGRTGQ